MCEGQASAGRIPFRHVGIDCGTDASAQGWRTRTKLLLDDLENFLLVKFLWKTLNGGQSLATITLCRQVSEESLGGETEAVLRPRTTRPWVNGRGTAKSGVPVESKGKKKKKRTLNAYMDVILSLFDFSGVLVGFGEGVCDVVG